MKKTPEEMNAERRAIKAKRRKTRQTQQEATFSINDALKDKRKFRQKVSILNRRVDSLFNLLTFKIDNGELVVVKDYDDHERIVLRKLKDKYRHTDVKWRYEPMIGTMFSKEKKAATA